MSNAIQRTAWVMAASAGIPVERRDEWCAMTERLFLAEAAMDAQPVDLLADLAAIRERDAQFGYINGLSDAHLDRRALLAHIDALAEAVEGLRSDGGGAYDSGFAAARAAVLAIIRCE